MSDNINTPPMPSNVMTPEEFLACYRDIKDGKRWKDEGGAAFKAATERFISLGGDKVALKIVELLQKVEDERAELIVRTTLQYASWLDLQIGTQLTMFEEAPVNLTAGVQAQHREWQAEQDGYAAGKAGEPVDNCPYATVSPYNVRWRSGHQDAVTAYSATLPKGD